MGASESPADVQRLMKISLLAGAALLVSTVPLLGLVMLGFLPMALRHGAFYVARTISLPGNLLLKAVIASPPAEAEVSLRGLSLVALGAGIDIVFWSAVVFGLLLAVSRRRLARQRSSGNREAP